MAVTKIFAHKRYTYLRSFSTKREAQHQAKVIRSEGRNARVTVEEVSYRGAGSASRYVVWVR